VNAIVDYPHYCTSGIMSDILHYLCLDDEGKHLCKEHNDEQTHVIGINCNLCLKDEISGHMLTNIKQYAEITELKEKIKGLKMDMDKKVIRIAWRAYLFGTVANHPGDYEDLLEEGTGDTVPEWFIDDFLADEL
jgi:hypothetical protein